jgi:hypothetical protein
LSRYMAVRSARTFFNPSKAGYLDCADWAAWVLFVAALGQFAFWTVWTMDQPIVDMWGFRPAQTAASVPYMLHQQAWFANIVPVFGEPWVLVQEFPLYQWCVALLAWSTGTTIDACGRIVSATFAIVTIWPVYLIANAAGALAPRRITLLVGTLWLCAPAVVFWGRSFLIETTSVFLALGWLAFYMRFLSMRSYRDWFLCVAFGCLAATVKIPTLACFIIVGFVLTCAHIWRWRRHWVGELLPLLALAGLTVLIPAAALFVWSSYADGFLTQNPFAAMLRVSSIPQWYFGSWSDRTSAIIWNWVVRQRDLPEALGLAWYIALVGLFPLGVRHRPFWWAITLIAGFVSGYLFFPVLRRDNPYYIVENAILLCGAVAIVIDGFLQRGYRVAGYAVLGITAAGQTGALYAGADWAALATDLHRHPYYQAGLAIRAATPPDSVIVGFGMGFGADIPYFSERRGIILANWFPVNTVRRVLFQERDRWFGGRRLGAVVDCSIYDNQRISPNLEPIRDELVRELPGSTEIKIVGTAYGATVAAPECDVFVLPR